MMNLYKIERIERVIKNFIYLDEYKMYSLSSQIFEGITEYLVSTSHNEEGEENTQKGEIGSGRILADIIKKTNTTQEKKYLHDYSYSIFEKHLLDNEKVIDINTTESKSLIDRIASKSFIKITGKVVFNDIGHLSRVMKDFNKMGMALARMNTTNNPNNKAKNVQQFAKENNLQLDDKFLKDLTYLLDFGFGNQLEIQIYHDDYLFSTNIKREYLREDENLLIKKYARMTEKEFTIFGIVTQFSNEKAMNKQENEDNKQLKVALMDMVSKFANIELSFTGKLENEIMIDPIAIYTEL